MVDDGRRAKVCNVDFELVASKDELSLNVFKDVDLMESLYSIAMPQPRRLGLDW